MKELLSLKDCKIEVLERIAEQLQLSFEKTLKNDSYKGSILGIKEQCKRLMCRAQEWKSKAFLVIVVGPVKSGKSTFVNLLAHEKVSPTHFLECTVRPSIISKKKDENAKSSITPFVTEGNPTMEHVDTIIDYVKGLEFADLGEIEKEDPCDLTDENLERKVSYRIGLEESEKGKVALTSITAQGGDFLQDNIFLIDMPGFDGVLANLDKPFYEAIVNRADLVVFVQSSNSAINKISEKFCELICKRNGSIPIYFIHNYFDSAYWHTEGEKKKVTEGHIKKALEFFQEQNMIVKEENCKCINLGKVTDARDKAFRKDGNRCISGYAEMLDSADELFSKMEQELYNKISSTQNRMRLQNCISRTVVEAEILRDLLNERIKYLQGLDEEYNRISALFDELKRKITRIDTTSFLGLEAKDARLNDKLKDIKKLFCENINYKAKYNTDSTRAKGRELIRMYRDATKSFIDSHFNPSSTQQAIQREYNSTFLLAIPSELKKYDSLLDTIQLAEKTIELDYSSIEKEYDVEVRIEKWWFFTRRGERVVECMTNIEHALFGLSLEEPLGFIPEEFYPVLLKNIEVWVKGIADAYYKNCKDKIDKTKDEVLKAVIVNEQEYKNEISEIKKLAEGVNKILNSINIK